MIQQSINRKTTFARHLRRQQTDAEHSLWRLLRDRRLIQLKFRRQQPIGPYFADFYCSRARLIIELDGSQHQEHIAYDQARTEFLEREGYSVLRFWDNDVLRSPEGVISLIQQSCSQIPHPQPSPQKGEGDKGRSPNL
jgi:very-short-patch-repair endonuclease